MASSNGTLLACRLTSTQHFSLSLDPQATAPLDGPRTSPLSRPERTRPMSRTRETLELSTTSEPGTARGRLERRRSAFLVAGRLLEDGSKARLLEMLVCRQCVRQFALGHHPKGYAIR